MVIPSKTLEGDDKVITYQDCDVEMPILSTGRLADDDHISTFHKTGGYILHSPSGHITRMFRIQGVYFVWLLIDKKLLPAEDSNEGFGRPG